MKNIMRKKIIGLVCFITLSLTCVNANAANLNVVDVLTQNELINEDGKIPDDIYELIEQYQNGSYCEDISDFNGQARMIFNNSNHVVASSPDEEMNTTYLYSTNQIGVDTFESTQIVVYASLNNESQDELHGVVIYNRITYEKKNFSGSAYNYIMLTKVNGGVVQNNGNYWCEALYLRYDVHGDAYTSAGSHVGYKGKDSGYSNQVYSPTVGTNYSISGPSDYYYSMGTYGTAVIGYTKGTISHRLSTSETLIATCAMTSM